MKAPDTASAASGFWNADIVKPPSAYIALTRPAVPSSLLPITQSAMPRPRSARFSISNVRRAMSAVAALSPFAMVNPAISMRFSARRSLCRAETVARN